MGKVELVDIVDIVDTVDMVNILYMVGNMDMVDNVNMVDSMVFMQKTFGYLKLLLDTSGWTRWTW